MRPHLRHHTQDVSILMFPDVLHQSVQSDEGPCPAHTSTVETTQHPVLKVNSVVLLIVSYLVDFYLCRLEVWPEGCFSKAYWLPFGFHMWTGSLA